MNINKKMVNTHSQKINITDWNVYRNVYFHMRWIYEQIYNEKINKYDSFGTFIVYTHEIILYAAAIKNSLKSAV